MNDKLKPLLEDSLFLCLEQPSRNYTLTASAECRLTFQETRQLIIMLRDWEQWGLPLPEERIPRPLDLPRGAWFKALKELYREDQNTLPVYPLQNPSHKGAQTCRPLKQQTAKRTLLGRCPVASERTRCCNLKTLDAVMGCSFGCHYCTIQSFYQPEAIVFHGDLEKKLNALNLDPDQYYHIGTGQSSDSLLWGNQFGMLDTLARFAENNPRVILEFKSKSDNIGWFLNNKTPRNMILTWSLNPEKVIANEEPGTATLENRLSAARTLADRGILVGFHFHPIMLYQGWKEEYREIAHRIRSNFRHEELVMISMGTLTYPKKALKTIRSTRTLTKVLKIPLTEIEGKFSYPAKLKEEMFSTVYNEFRDWHDKLFFYLCMEDIALWQPVLGREYHDNEAFEQDMLTHYASKIHSLPG